MSVNLSTGTKHNHGLVYPYPELVVISRGATASYVYFYIEFDTSGDSAAIVDFVIKINGTPATLTTWTDNGDSVIRINISETINAGDVITMSYTPNALRWIYGYQGGSPDHVLFAMTDESVTNHVV